MHIAEAGAVARGPAVLYLPASGPGGSGEYVRCLMLARALARRWPDAQARFMVNRNAAYAHEVPFPSVLLDSSPTHATAAVTALLARERFDLVVFDSSGRAAQLEAAKRAGATTVFVSSRPNARRKGLRLQRVRNIDQHWIVQPQWLTAAPTPWERFKKRWLGHIRTLYLDAMLEESPPEQRGAVQREFGLEAAEYVVFCAGGGGKFGRGPSVAERLHAAAAEVAVRTGTRCVVVLGPNYAAPSQTFAGVLSIAQLPNAALMDLLREAQLVVTGGGALLLQALVLGRPCIGVPVAGDQAARLRRCRQRGLIESAAPQAADISAAAVALLGAPQRQRQLRERVAAVGLKNGLEVAVAAVERVLLERQSR